MNGDDISTSSVENPTMDGDLAPIWRPNSLILWSCFRNERFKIKNVIGKEVDVLWISLWVVGTSSPGLREGLSCAA
jgi:hypothetical protein